MKPQDFERLSAYIDNQLSPAEKAALEARLAQDSELREALRELRLTVRTLRSVPALKPPRSFTLTPAQVGSTARRNPWFPTLRLAAALSAVVLAVVIAGDLAGGIGRPAMVATTGQDAAPEIAMVTTEATAAAAAPAVLMATTETEAADEEAAAEIMSAPAEATPMPAGAGGAIDGSAATQAALAYESATPTPDTTALRSMVPTPTPSEKAVAEDAALTPAAPEAPPAPTDTLTQDAYGFVGDRDAQPQPGLPAVRIIEIALAVLTVMLGLGAWFTRR